MEFLLRGQQLGLMSNGAVFVGKFVDISSKQYAMNEMFKEFLTEVDSGARPTKYALCTALNVCAKTLNWNFGLQFHA